MIGLADAIPVSKRVIWKSMCADINRHAIRWKVAPQLLRLVPVDEQTNTGRIANRGNGVPVLSAKFLKSPRSTNVGLGGCVPRAP